MLLIVIVYSEVYRTEFLVKYRVSLIPFTNFKIELTAARCMDFRTCLKQQYLKFEET